MHRNCRDPSKSAELPKRRNTSRCGGVASAFSIKKQERQKDGHKDRKSERRIDKRKTGEHTITMATHAQGPKQGGGAQQRHQAS